MTPKQRSRQKFREHGRYAQVHPCYVCGESAGEGHFSHPDTDVTIGDELICLCEKCYLRLSKLDGKDAIKQAFQRNPS